MKIMSPFKSLFYTGLFMILVPVAIVVIMTIFHDTGIAKKTPAIDVVAPKPVTVTVSKKKDTIIPIVTAEPLAKPKKKKVETVIDSVKIKEIKIDSIILNKDSI